MKTFSLFSLLLFSSLSWAQVTQLSASVDRNTVLLDESITLTLIASGDAERDAVEFTALQRDFSINRPSFSQSTQIINGSMTRTMSWKINLYPLDVGKFTIPSFTIDGQSSASFDVTVLPVNTQSQSEPRDYFVEATVSDSTVYLQQQLLYTIKIHLSQDIQRGNLSLPTLDGAIIEQIGEDKDYQEITDGVRYRIIERNYAIIPQSSGEFTISGPIFEAQVLTNSRQSFANFGRTRTIARRAPNIDIKVQAMPENYSYAWLPSEYVEVNEEWQGNATTLQEGEPITRTITLTAIGLTKEQLPDIETPYHPSFKVYPEQVQLNSVEHNNAIVAQGIFNTAIIPSASGSYTLPEVSVPWFNVNTGKTEYATIAARTIDVLAKADMQIPNESPLAESASTNANDLANQTDTSAVVNDASTAPSWWLYVLISSNVFTLLLLLVLWFSRTQNNSAKQTVASMPISHERNEEPLFLAIKAQLERGSVNQLSQQLNTWLLALLGSKHHSVSLSLSKSPDSAAAHSALSQYNKVLASRYANTQAETDFPALIKSLQDYRNHIIVQKAQSPLRNLYPS